MRFLVDECCEPGIAASVRGAGHDVVYAVESLRGRSDEDIVARATLESRVIITDDKDFAALLFRERRKSPGLLLLRIDSLQRERRVRAVLDAIERFGDRLHVQATVLFPGAVRVRLLGK